jgi:hypothetical protein
MIIFRPFNFESEPILGEAIQLEILGNGFGILFGAPWLKVEFKEFKLVAKKFGTAIIFRKLPVSLNSPDLPSVRRRARIVKASDVVKIIIDKPIIKLTLISFPSFQKHVVYINSKGIVMNAPEFMMIKQKITSSIRLGIENYYSFNKVDHSIKIKDLFVALGKIPNLQLKSNNIAIKLISVPNTEELKRFKKSKIN